MAARYRVRGALLPDGFKPRQRSAPRGEETDKLAYFQSASAKPLRSTFSKPPLWPLQVNAAFTVHFGHISKYPAF